MDPKHCRSVFLAALLAGAAIAAAGCGRDADSLSQAAGGNVDRATAAAAAAQGEASPLQTANMGPDTEITSRVRQALSARADLKSQQIFVDTADGVVTLSGAVDSTALRDQAKQIARRVTGVKHVIDLIAVKAGSATG
jgi:hyperosmotically inducible protein